MRWTRRCRLNLYGQTKKTTILNRREERRLRKHIVRVCNTLGGVPILIETHDEKGARQTKFAIKEKWTDTLGHGLSREVARE
jgi:hypothetical protein